MEIFLSFSGRNGLPCSVKCAHSCSVSSGLFDCRFTLSSSWEPRLLEQLLPCLFMGKAVTFTVHLVPQQLLNFNPTALINTCLLWAQPPHCVSFALLEGIVANTSNIFFKEEIYKYGRFVGKCFSGRTTGEIWENPRKNGGWQVCIYAYNLCSSLLLNAKEKKDTYHHFLSPFKTIIIIYMSIMNLHLPILDTYPFNLTF